MSEQTQVAQPSDAKRLAEIAERLTKATHSRWSVSGKPPAPDAVGKLIDGDIAWLLEVVKRQQRQLAECETALTIWADWMNMPFLRFQKVYGKASDDQWVAAIRDLAEEVRRGTH